MNKKWTAEDVTKVLQLIQNLNIDSLDREILTNESTPNEARLGDFIEDNSPSPQEIVERKELHDNLIEAINKLPPRQMSVILLRFGLVDGNPKTLEEVGQMYGVTRERIRQLETKALDKLRWLLITKYKMKE